MGNNINAQHVLYTDWRYGMYGTHCALCPAAIVVYFIFFSLVHKTITNRRQFDGADA